MTFNLPFGYFLSIRLYKLPPRDSEGRFISQDKITQDRMTELLRKEQAARSVVDWSELKQASKKDVK